MLPDVLRVIYWLFQAKLSKQCKKPSKETTTFIPEYQFNPVQERVQLLIFATSNDKNVIKINNIYKQQGMNTNTHNPIVFFARSTRLQKQIRTKRMI